MRLSRCMVALVVVLLAGACSTTGDATQAVVTSEAEPTTTTTITAGTSTSPTSIEGPPSTTSTTEALRALDGAEWIGVELRGVPEANDEPRFTLIHKIASRTLRLEANGPYDPVYPWFVGTVGDSRTGPSPRLIVIHDEHMPWLSDRDAVAAMGPMDVTVIAVEEVGVNRYEVTDMRPLILNPMDIERPAHLGTCWTRDRDKSVWTIGWSEEVVHREGDATYGHPPYALHVANGLIEVVDPETVLCCVDCGI